MMGGESVLLVVGQVAGGAGRHVHELATGLVARGHRITVAAPPEVLDRYDFAGTGASLQPVSIADRPHPTRDAATVRSLRTLARSHDVVHAHGLRAAALAALTRSGVPLVATLHNAAPVGRAPGVLFAGLVRLVARVAAVVLVVSPDLEQLMLARGARDVRAAVVAAAPPRSPSRPAAEVRTELGDPRCLAVTVGRLAPQKDLDLLLDAMSLLDVADRPTVAVAGDGPLRDQLAERALDEHLPVMFLGARDDVPDLLAAADFAVSSARWEGQPVWLQEALRAGLPVVATDVGGTRGIVGEAGEWVAHGDPSALAAAIAAVAHDRSLRDSLAKQALSRAAALPDRNAALDAAEQVYRDTLR